MLKIAQIAPLYEPVPPKLYGGTERVVSYLTEELIRLGHEVTLFASGDSVTRARLIPVHHQALRLAGCTDPVAYHVLQLQEVMERAHEFDVLHFHTDYLHFPLTRLSGQTTLTTLHGRLDLPELLPLYRKFCDRPVVSISDAQREPLPMAGWMDTVYHGLPPDLYRPGDGSGGYAAFIGRISPEKRVDRAIEIAGRAGISIKIAAKIDKVDNAYYEKHIRHLFDLPHVEYIGEIGEKEKGDFLGKACALLFPIDWPEPFGMVMIEAMACGTPVIAFKSGSVPEVIDEGLSGYMVKSTGEAADALTRIDRISRLECRRVFENRFTAARMAEEYVRLYKTLLRYEGRIVSFKPGTGKRLYPLNGDSKSA